jgi:rod shape determining protein RodA
VSYLEYNVKSAPAGLRKFLYINWLLVITLTAICCIGFLMLYSVAGGALDRWAEPQIQRFVIGMAGMLVVAMIPIWFWRSMAGLAYAGSIVLLILVEFVGITGGGAQRWIDLGFMRLQPSEVTKITLVMALAAYYDRLPTTHVSRPFWVLLPVLLILLPVAFVLRQPDLGTSILLIAAGGGLMYLAGVHWGYFLSVIAAATALVLAVFQTRGTDAQLLKDYQYKRIDIFLDPSKDPLGDGYHITQSKISLGAGGWTGRGFMQGTQSRLNFLPEKHTDFIFSPLAEEFGFVGGISLLLLYTLVIVFCISSALINRDRFSHLLMLGIQLNFFLFFAVNMSMVMGMAPVVGVPLPLVSYGGSAMLVLLLAFGLVQSAHVHRPR